MVDGFRRQISSLDDSFYKWGLSLIRSRLKLILYLICGLTDFASFAVIFAVSRALAEGRAES